MKGEVFNLLVAMFYGNQLESPSWPVRFFGSRMFNALKEIVFLYLHSDFLSRYLKTTVSWVILTAKLQNKACKITKPLLLHLFLHAVIMRFTFLKWGLSWTARTIVLFSFRCRPCKAVLEVQHRSAIFCLSLERPKPPVKCSFPLYQFLTISFADLVRACCILFFGFHSCRDIISPHQEEQWLHFSYSDCECVHLLM